jgi:hypothetical protein
MNSLGKSNIVTKSKLPIAHLAAALVLGPVASSTAEGYEGVAHDQLTRHLDARSSPSARHQVADPPYSFACTTEAGLRPGCIGGWVYRSVLSSLVGVP